MNIESWLRNSSSKFAGKFFDTDCFKGIFEAYLDTVHEQCPGLMSEDRLLDQGNSALRIVNAGMMNSGKSSLFNSLMGRDVFDVQDVRCTQQNQTAVWGSDSILTDTPGLGANESDTGVAYESFRKADLVVFVHVADKGGLTMAEIRFINDLKKILGEDLQKRLVIVLSKIDNSAISRDANAVSQIIKEVSGNLLQEAGLSNVRIFPVSNSRYKKGTAENKAVLVQKCGIPELTAYIRDFKKNYRKDPYADALRNGGNALSRIRKVFSGIPVDVQQHVLDDFGKRANAASQKIGYVQREKSAAVNSLLTLLSSAKDELKVMSYSIQGSTYFSVLFTSFSARLDNIDIRDYSGEISDQREILAELTKELPEAAGSSTDPDALKQILDAAISARQTMLKKIRDVIQSISSAVQKINSNSGTDSRELLASIFDVNRPESISCMIKDLGE